MGQKRGASSLICQELDNPDLPHVIYPEYLLQQQDYYAYAFLPKLLISELSSQACDSGLFTHNILIQKALWRPGGMRYWLIQY